MSSGAEFIRKPVDAAEAGAPAFSFSPAERAANPQISAVALPSRRRSILAGETSVTGVSLPRSRRSVEGRRLRNTPSEPTDAQPSISRSKYARISVEDELEAGDTVTRIRVASRAFVDKLGAMQQVKHWNVLSRPEDQIQAGELSANQVKELAKKDARAQEGFEEARNVLVIGHLGLDRALAGNFAGRSISRDDLEGTASLALVEAAERYDPAYGDFAPFASTTIVGNIREAFRNDMPIHIVRQERDTGVAVRDAVDSLIKDLNRTPSEQEITDAINEGRDEKKQVSFQDVRAALRGVEVVSLDNAENGNAFQTDSRRNTEVEALSNIIGEEIENMISILSPKLQSIVRLRFWGDMSSAEIAQVAGYHEVYVAKLLRDAMTQMRQSIEERGVEDDYRPMVRRDTAPAADQAQTALEGHQTRIRGVFEGHEELSTNQIALLADGRLGSSATVRGIMQKLVATGEYIKIGNYQNTRYRRAQGHNINDMHS